MSEVIVITSGKGGVGKTTTVANIGTGLAVSSSVCPDKRQNCSFTGTDDQAYRRSQRGI